MEKALLKIIGLEMKLFTRQQNGDLAIGRTVTLES